MQRRNCLFPALFELLTHPKWPVRLGAMVVMETLAETDPALASGAVAPLLGAFEGLDTQAKGDVLYVLGETGDADVLPFIEKTAEDAAGELKSAAEDAIDRIRRRTANPGKEAP
jgi:HEAT repeat protein